MKTERLIIYPKDIALILGKSPRQSRRLMSLIKSKLHKQNHHLLTINEFCGYYNIPVADVLNKLKY